MPTMVFVSRPSKIDDRFVPGLEGFLRFLGNQGLTPRTIGVSDYPTECPVDEVLSVMKLCRGAVILGYPQVTVQQGLLRDQPIPSAVLPSLLLPTEWNHIEASIAYSLRRPLLVIHHPGIARGVFDHGALPAFIYSRDLTDPSWPLAPEILGAVNTWKERVLTTPFFAGLDEKPIDRTYANYIGLENALKKDGFRIFWGNPAELPLYLDLLGYERIVWADSAGVEWLLAAEPGGSVPLKTRKSSDEVSALMQALAARGSR